MNQDAIETNVGVMVANQRIIVHGVHTRDNDRVSDRKENIKAREKLLKLKARDTVKFGPGSENQSRLDFLQVCSLSS